MLLNMSELLKPAMEHGFAIPAFNIGTGQILNAVIEASEEMKAPVILAIHPLELEFQGESFVKMCIDRAQKTKIPCCIHLDHSAWEDIVKAVRAGFTSVMIDGSHLPFEENIAITKKVCEFAHLLDVSVEAELGTIGTTDGDAEGGSDTIIYTNPDDAKRFVEETGCDTLAIAIGTAHGIYPAGMKPKLKQELLSEIRSKVDIPLVLHGGSGNEDAEIAEAVKRGISKINISSDIKDAFYQRLRLTLEDKKLREPFELYKDSIEAMKEVCRQKIVLFNNHDKLSHYQIFDLLSDELVRSKA
ncbi:MAG: ketose-bisphosphate aldolase [Johnsonella sp.]|nr:ketose-bisphosphate aldolase [Johnsonella sp.]